MTRNLLVFALAALLLAILGSPARAQPVGRTLVLPAVAGGPLDATHLRVADAVEAALQSRHARVVSNHEARDRFLASSRPPASPESSDLDVLAREAHAALEHVAFGRSAAAQRSVQEVLSRAERALESLNRETATARHVLDACLALVRNALSRDQRRDALAEAMRCRRLVPDVSPSEMLHPASVIGVLAEADDQLRRMRIGRLIVDSIPESGCAAYVNGRHLGVTPFRLDRAAAGEYRVQVECGPARGRVHLVQLGDEPVSLIVDVGLDRALHTDDRVALVYANAEEASSQAVGHAAGVARTVRADEAIVVLVRGAEAELLRVSANQARVLGRASFAWVGVDGAESSELDAAVERLLEGRVELPAPAAAPVAAPDEKLGEPQPVVALASPAPEDAIAEAPIAPQDKPERAPGDIRKRRMRWASAGLATGGLALLGAGIAFEVKHQAADSDLSSLTGSGQGTSARALALSDDYDRTGDLRWMGVAGGALLTAAVPLARIDVSRGVPWWSYVVGGAGAGLAAWGTFELTRNNECELSLTTGGCVDRRDSLGRGVLLWSAAVPLLTVPVALGIERLSSRRDRATSAFVAPSATSLMVVLRTETGPW